MGLKFINQRERLLEVLSKLLIPCHLWAPVSFLEAINNSLLNTHSFVESRYPPLSPYNCVYFFYCSQCCHFFFFKKSDHITLRLKTILRFPTGLTLNQSWAQRVDSIRLSLSLPFFPHAFSFSPGFSLKQVSLASLLILYRILLIPLQNPWHTVDFM